LRKSRRPWLLGNAGFFPLMESLPRNKLQAEL
jgi:hypothetical protein